MVSQHLWKSYLPTVQAPWGKCSFGQDLCPSHCPKHVSQMAVSACKKLFLKIPEMLLSESSCASFLGPVPHGPSLRNSHQTKHFIQISVGGGHFFSPKSPAGCPWGEMADFSSLSLLSLRGFEFMYNVLTAVTQVPGKKIFWKRISLLWSVQLSIKHLNVYWSPVCYHLWH